MTNNHSDPELLFGSWLAETKKLQEESFGFDFDALADSKRDHADYIRTNAIAAVAEIVEALEETRWKPWAKNGVLAVVPDKRAFAKEMVDCLHFISNALVSAGVTDEEFNELYLEKMQVNRERQARAGGYQSVTGVDKCPVCRRSFDDVGQAPGTEICVKCHELTAEGAAD